MNPLPPAFFLSLTVLTDLVTDMTQLRNEWANQQFSITFIIAVKKTPEQTFISIIYR